MALADDKRSRTRRPWYEHLTFEEIFERDREAWNLPKPRRARPVEVTTVAGTAATASTHAVTPRSGAR